MKGQKKEKDINKVNKKVLMAQKKLADENLGKLEKAIDHKRKEA